MSISNRNRNAKFLPIGALLVLLVLAVAGAESETAYLRRALGVDIGFSCADWLAVYMDAPESVNVDELLSPYEDYVSTVEVEDGHMKQVLNYEAVKSAGLSARAIELVERMTEYYNDMVDIILEGAPRCVDMTSCNAAWDMKMVSEYPRVHAYFTMLGYDEPDDCR